MQRFLRFCILLFVLVPVCLSADPLYSPTWGFRLDLPHGYEYTEGNDFDRFSFEGPNRARFDIAVYNGVYQDIEQMVQDVNRRLGNTGDAAFFDYADSAAVIIELSFNNIEGWGIGVELPAESGMNPPLLLALAYAPAGIPALEFFHLSALDSIIPSLAHARRPGPVMEFGFPRGRLIETGIAGTALTAIFRENDAEAAQALVDREFAVLSFYEFSHYWQEAWIRFFRMIYRDSWDRIADAVFRLERSLNVGAENTDNRAFAERALSWIQGFEYERDFEGSDFINLVTGITEGRGDCDSRAMLWAMILSQANIPAAMMVSRNHSHAMGLADLPGAGARFEAEGVRWLVAETTERVGLGLIAADMSDIESWLGVVFE